MKGAGGGRRARAAALILTCLVLVAGCRRSSSPDGEDPTITEAPSTSATTTTAPTEITNPMTTSTLVPLDQDPPVIDLAYAQRILDELSRLDGEASRILYRDKRMTAEVEGILTSIFYASSLEDVRRALATDFGVGLQTWRDPPGDPDVRAVRVLSSRTGCIALRAHSNLGPRYAGTTDIQRNIGIILQRNIEPTAAERQINPTLWVQTVGSTKIPDSELLKACQ